MSFFSKRYHLTVVSQEEYEQKLLSTGNTFDVEIEVQHLDENFGKKNSLTSGDLIGENERYSTFTTDILDNMYSGSNPKNYVLKKGTKKN